jgi:hypothetical protein
MAARARNTRAQHIGDTVFAMASRGLCGAIRATQSLEPRSRARRRPRKPTPTAFIFTQVYAKKNIVLIQQHMRFMRAQPCRGREGVPVHPRVLCEGCAVFQTLLCAVRKRERCELFFKIKSL